MFSGSGSSPTIPGKVDPLTSSRKSGSPAFWVTQALECGMAVPGGTAIPHFNVWVTREAGLPLLPELVRRLPGSVGDDPESKNMLKNQADAQVEMTMEEVIAVIVAEDAREQRTPTKANGGNAARDATGGSTTPGVNDGSATHWGARRQHQPWGG
eukprot:jgi/Undpi1/13176/HiC_scaffold_8.g02838.m1